MTSKIGVYEPLPGRLFSGIFKYIGGSEGFLAQDPPKSGPQTPKMGHFGPLFGGPRDRFWAKIAPNRQGFLEPWAGRPPKMGQKRTPKMAHLGPRGDKGNFGPPETPF